ncbi:MAG: peptidoglycan bridge formation glycyltransferase FemA/FemB family protein [Candidatus Atribacteria bacterium]|nr:MAG: peptidoglycan bridge formation glycyltransferase FemA/FemB family protein [Candidatus Atribacteria bacterium]
MKSTVRITSDISEISRKEWSEFVISHPQGNIFQTPEMFDISVFSFRSNPVAVFCVRNDKICGIALAVIHKESKGLLGNLTSRAVITGGPLIEGDDPEIAGGLLEYLNGILSGRVIYLEIRNLFDVTALHDRFLEYGYMYEQHLNFLIDLTQGKELLFKNLHPTRRKQIERSRRRGVTVRVAEEPDGNLVMKCYNILSGVYRNAGLPLPGAEYFINAIEHLSSRGIVLVFLAESNSEIIGFRFVLCFKQIIYDWYAGSSHIHLNKYPNDILSWEVLLWGVNNDYELFDFGGAGRPEEHYGVRDFKMKFGGTAVSYGRYRIIFKKTVYGIIRMIFPFYKKIMQKK